MNTNKKIIDINLLKLKTKQNFLNILNQELNFPSYFGSNLDALDECMRDLGWIQEKEIILNFNNINKLKNRNSELFYLIHDSLSFYKQYWEENNHEKIVTINF
ncbi:Barstar (barnase inhibitor) [Mycobacteroides abscessus subsp. abscessus]|nr:Barstar (barnase inhibitor) [Mycobacteroides abscessus subsp. abscessus]